MRYIIFTYFTKPSGKIDEVLSLTKKIKPKDWQTANVIMDFKEQKILLCSVAGISANKDWDTIVSYYYTHYPATIERLFQENGHSVDIKSHEQVEKS
jgi:hypothetical protein